MKSTRESLSHPEKSNGMSSPRRTCGPKYTSEPDSVYNSGEPSREWRSLPHERYHMNI
jgi:hypothetical protein